MALVLSLLLRALHLHAKLSYMNLIFFLCLRFAEEVQVEDCSELAFTLALNSVFPCSVIREKSSNGNEAEEEGTLFCKGFGC